MTNRLHFELCLALTFDMLLVKHNAFLLHEIGVCEFSY